MFDRLRKRFEPQLSRLGGSDTAKAAGLAGAMVANNVIALGSVIVFSRLLDDYGSLAALVSYFLILAVVGYAMQLATAREAVLGHLGVGAGMAATIRNWMKWLLVFTRADDRPVRAVPASDRRGGRGQGAMGGGTRDPGGLLLPDAVHPARLPPGARRLPRGRHQPRRRAGRPARDRRRARRRSGFGVTGRLHRDAAVVHRDDGLLRRPAPPPARRWPSPDAGRPCRCGPTCGTPGRQSRRSGSSRSSRTSTSSPPSTASRPISRAPTAPPRWPRRS